MLVDTVRAAKRLPLLLELSSALLWLPSWSLGLKPAFYGRQNMLAHGGSAHHGVGEVIGQELRGPLCEPANVTF